MPTDPAEEWRRLSTLYSEMGDIEIQELADQINDLTPAAQQILRDELKKRSLAIESEPHAGADSMRPLRKATVNYEPARYRYNPGSDSNDGDGEHEFTWKVPLCDCETRTEARRIATMLQRAGIDSWIEAPGDSARILVGADQLDQAELIAAQPVPQDILDEERELEAAAQYELPTCPHCGAPDPILESVEPSNNWLCESCDHTWSDPIPDDSTGQGTPS
jgi:cell division septation protein DedD